MSGFKYNIEDLKKEYIGKTFNYFTVLDVFRDDKNIIVFKCQCKCGNIRNVPKKNILNNKYLSCGCYRQSNEYKEKRSAILKSVFNNNPEISKKISNKRKQWYKDNPDKAKELAEKSRQLYIVEPERREAVGKRISNWFATDDNGVKIWAEHRRQFYKTHPEIGYARSQLYKDNPEVLEKIAEGNRKFNREHPDKVKRTNNINKQIAKEKRKIFSSYENTSPCCRHKFICKDINEHRRKRMFCNIKILLNIIHPDYYEALMSGDLASYDTIETKCPICCEYDKHKMHNVFIFNKNKFKNNKPPMCRNCVNKSITSSYEKEIEDYIRSFYNGEIIRNTRNIISPLELDIYIPEKKIAVEFNGDYFHNEDHKDKDYHINKYLKCKEKGILLISIFESKWNSNKDSIKEYLKDLFSGKENKLSFNEDHTLMNNNYPSNYFYKKCSQIIEDYYVYNNKKIFTCGYSKIN